MLRATLTRLYQNRKALLTLFAGVLLPLLLFGQLAAGMHREGGFRFDRQILTWIGGRTNPTWDQWVAAATRFGYVAAVPVLIGVAIGIRWLLEHPRGAAFFAASTAGSHGLNLLAKEIFQRTRPALWTSAAPESTYSFPSGHAMISMSVATALVILLWPTKWRPLVLGAAPCVLAISFSRLYLGVHYPSDILAGWCAGAVWVAGVWVILLKPSSFASASTD